MQMLDKIPGEKFSSSDWNDVYLKPGTNPRRVDIVHQVYEEPAVAAWRAAMEARKVYGGKEGQKGTPKGQSSKWG